MRILGWMLIAVGSVQMLAGMVGYTRATREAYYDAIAASTLFDGRWIVGALLAAFGAVMALQWPFYSPLLVGLAAFVTALPVKSLIRLARRR